MAKLFWKSSEDLLNDSREKRKTELSVKCQEDILSGFTYKDGNEEYQVSYDRESQANLQERYALFENNLIETIPMTLHKGEEDVRLLVNKDQFTQIYLTSVLEKENKISKLRDVLFPLVDEATTEEEIENISWDMDVPEVSEPPIEFDESNTLGKQVSETKEQSKRTQQSLSMTNSGLLELTLLTMMGGN